MIFQLIKEVKCIMKAGKKLVSGLLAGSMMLLTACCYAESVHQIEKQTTPIYYADMETENKGEVDLFFVDGVKDVPYITVETAKDILVSNVRKLDAPNYDLTVKKDGEKCFSSGKSCNFATKLDE